VPEAAALAARYRGIVLDLDGVVYLGDQVVPAAPAALEGVRGLGVHLAFVTNNSFRPPELLASRLGRLGVKAAAEEILTSAHATVRLLGGEEGLDGVNVLVVGGPGLRRALQDAGARLIDTADWRQAEVVAVGFDPDLTYERVRTAALAIRAGARFVGSNPDTTLPTPEGFWPGAGATLAMLRAATGVRPEVAGKPAPALFETVAAAIGPGPYLMVGDRADTDLDGAHRLGWSTALVLSGVVAPADLPDLVVAPDHLLADVGGLLDPPGPAIREATPADAQAADALLATCQDPATRHTVPAAPAVDPAATPAATAGREPRGATRDAPGTTADGPQARATRGAAAPAVGAAATPPPTVGREPPGATRGPAAPAVGAAATPAPTAGREPPGTTRRTAAADRGATLVADDGAGVVGAVAWRRRGELAVVTGPVVEDRWRGRLVGTRLLVAACMAARAAGLRRVAAVPGHGFLARLGFRPPGPEGPGGAAPSGPEGPGGLLVRDLRDPPPP
jgi:glycerol-1-phosphatase